VVKRSTQYKKDKNLTTQILTKLRAHTDTKIVGDIAASICEKVAAKLDINLELLGGVVKTGDIELKATQKAIIKKLEAKIAAKIEADLQLKVFASLEDTLVNLLSPVTDLLPESQLLDIILDLEGSLVAKLKAEIPEIVANLSGALSGELDIVVKGFEINLPGIIELSIGADVESKVDLKAEGKAAVSTCSSLDLKSTAQAVLKDLKQ
ncbi:hypothetical protein BCR43DRAFT_441469, partial [Syncephalastrum racemosum]